MTIALGINIDHIATLRQARRGRYPDPMHAALAAEMAGADSITLHLREDRRHIQDNDVRVLRGLLKTHMNLEMAVTDEMLRIAARSAAVRLLPRAGEARGDHHRGRPGCRQPDSADDRGRHGLLGSNGIRVSLFIDPDPHQIEAAAQIGAPVVELHTGAYAEHEGAQQATELERLRAGARLAAGLGITVHAGHGLNYHNVQPVAAIRDIVELNIGHSIVARAVFDGLAVAIRDMKQLMVAARS